MNKQLLIRDIISDAGTFPAAPVSMENIAVLIDGENISSHCINRILFEASEYGNVTDIKVFGDFLKPGMKSWERICSEYMLIKMECPSISIRKNSSDHYLVIDAMKMIFYGKYDVIVIASSDSDFASLAQEIRNAGIKAVGMGERKTNPAFRKSYDEFILLDQLLVENGCHKDIAKSCNENDRIAMKNLGFVLDAIIDELKDGEGNCLLSVIGKKLEERIRGFRCKDFGCGPLSHLVSHLGYEIREIQKGAGTALAVAKRVRCVKEKTFEDSYKLEEQMKIA